MGQVPSNGTSSDVRLTPMVASGSYHGADGTYFARRFQAAVAVVRPSASFTIVFRRSPSNA